jgi:hypothetical protein
MKVTRPGTALAKKKLSTNIEGLIENFQEEAAAI